MTNDRKRGRPPHADILTPAEWRVAEAVRHGLTNPAIATRQGVSTDAVKYHVANALQKLGFSSRKQLQQWGGIARVSPLHRKDMNVTHETRIGPVSQIARSVRNICEARKWYGDVLGLEHLYSFGNLAFFDCGGLRLFLSENEDPVPESIIYFRVDDVHAAHTHMRGKGITFLNAPHMVHCHDDGTEEWMAFFNDNEERPLAIMSQAKAGSDKL